MAVLFISEHEDYRGPAAGGIIRAPALTSPPRIVPAGCRCAADHNPGDVIQERAGDRERVDRLPAVALARRDAVESRTVWSVNH